jgi:hypothetical protein
LESIVQSFFDQQVNYQQQELSLEEAYRLYVQSFSGLLEAVNEQLEHQTVLLDNQPVQLTEVVHRWEDLSGKQQQKFQQQLLECLASLEELHSFEPLGYRPIELEKRLGLLLNHSPTVEAFPLFADWEEKVLQQNKIPYYKDNKTSE